MTLESDHQTASGRWPESLSSTDSESPTKNSPPTGNRRLAYAVFLSSVFWLGVLLLSHLNW